MWTKCQSTVEKKRKKKYICIWIHTNSHVKVECDLETKITKRNFKSNLRAPANLLLISRALTSVIYLDIDYSFILSVQIKEDQNGKVKNRSKNKI